MHLLLLLLMRVRLLLTQHQILAPVPRLHIPRVRPFEPITAACALMPHPPHRRDARARRLKKPEERQNSEEGAQETAADDVETRVVVVGVSGRGDVESDGNRDAREHQEVHRRRVASVEGICPPAR